MEIISITGKSHIISSIPLKGVIVMHSRDSIQWLLKQGPQAVQDWCYRIWEGREPIPIGFDWKHLAAAIDLEARAGKGPSYYKHPDIEWARVAISLYHYLMKQASPLECIEIDLRIMYLKGYLIIHFGSIAGDPILDVDHIVEWFYHNLIFPRDTIEEKCSSPDQLTYEELISLRFLKERLIILQFLLDNHHLKPNEELLQWLAMREKLP